jgi:hypothetical protein
MEGLSRQRRRGGPLEAHKGTNHSHVPLFRAEEVELRSYDVNNGDHDLMRSAPSLPLHIPRFRRRRQTIMLEGRPEDK